MERHLNPYIEIPPLIRKAVLSISILHFPLAVEVSLEATSICSLIPLVIQIPVQILEKLIAPDGAHLPGTRPVPDSCRFFCSLVPNASPTIRSVDRTGPEDNKRQTFGINYTSSL